MRLDEWTSSLCVVSALLIEEEGNVSPVRRRRLSTSSQKKLERDDTCVTLSRDALGF